MKNIKISIEITKLLCLNAISISIFRYSLQILSWVPLLGIKLDWPGFISMIITLDRSDVRSLANNLMSLFKSEIGQ